MFDPKLSRRQLLKAGASSAVLALAGYGGGSGASASDAEITSAAIHPAIGIARIGNSTSGYYLGPELPGTVPIAPGGFKDASGAIKRQAARFRVYGLDRNGRVVRELTADEAEITWRVHLTNAKAAWYDFNTALDIPEAQPTPRRNATYVGAARAALIIDPGARDLWPLSRPRRLRWWHLPRHRSAARRAAHRRCRSPARARRKRAVVLAARCASHDLRQQRRLVRRHFRRPGHRDRTTR